ncbi:CU044_2847 family protein [Streptomyces sp. NPDC014995]|uniref:CU044_2847 family protein n=1 Tax=Streptomyces sp. NPDC014995 TaxID=3364936 RepID=UPI0036FB1225
MHLARIAMGNGGFLLVEAPAAVAGPVKAGRVGDAIHELPGSLQAALAPITVAARATLDQLRKAGPEGITVQFGIDLAVEAGAVITKSSANCHLTVTMSWQRSPGSSGSDDWPD